LNITDRHVTPKVFTLHRSNGTRRYLQKFSAIKLHNGFFRRAITLLLPT